VGTAEARDELVSVQASDGKAVQAAGKDFVCALVENEVVGANWALIKQAGQARGAKRLLLAELAVHSLLLCPVFVNNPRYVTCPLNSISSKNVSAYSKLQLMVRQVPS